MEKHLLAPHISFWILLKGRIREPLHVFHTIYGIPISIFDQIWEIWKPQGL